MVKTQPKVKVIRTLKEAKKYGINYHRDRIKARQRSYFFLHNERKEGDHELTVNQSPDKAAVADFHKRRREGKV